MKKGEQRSLFTCLTFTLHSSMPYRAAPRHERGDDRGVAVGETQVAARRRQADPVACGDRDGVGDERGGVGADLCREVAFRAFVPLVVNGGSGRGRDYLQRRRGSDRGGKGHGLRRDRRCGAGRGNRDDRRSAVVADRVATV